jgi:hypothetical protein
MPFFPRGKSGRRREDDGVHAVTFELDNLEFVQASEDIGLLRLGGRWIAPVSRALGDMMLLVHRDSEVLELAPLPDMNGLGPVASPAGEVWRGAFTMTVEVAEDPRTELVLVAGGPQSGGDATAEVALPRPDEWDEVQLDEAAPERDELDAGSEPESPVVAQLVAKLDEVARLDLEAEATLVDPDPIALPSPSPSPSPEREPLSVTDRLPEPEVPHAELTVLRAELDMHRIELAAAQAELEAERRRREALEQELRSHTSVEEDLRNAIAMQEAEMASAVAQASQRARQAERRRDLAPVTGAGDDPERSRSRPADEEFLARLERARRASEAAAG